MIACFFDFVNALLTHFPVLFFRRTVTLANGSSYVAEGENMKRWGVELGAGVSFKVGGNTDIGLSYEGKFKSHYTDHTGLINVRYNF